MDRNPSITIGAICLLALGALAWQMGAAVDPTLHLEQLTLERGGCFGACPVYRITVFGDGRVEYEGRRYVRVDGTRSKQLSPGDVRRLTREIERIDYFNLRDQYDSPRDGCAGVATDLPGVTTSVRADGRSKKIYHYHGCMPGFGTARTIEQLKGFEDFIDRVVQTELWVGGDRDLQTILDTERQRLDARKRKALAEKEREEAERRTRAEVSNRLQLAVRLEAEGKSDEAVKAYIAAADHGNCAATLRLVEIYTKGTSGVQPDAAKAQMWSNSGKARGCPDPELGRRLEAEGKGDEAVKAYTAAAAGGSCTAARRLFEIYTKGIRGVQSDASKAQMWSNYPKDVWCPDWNR